ncbi:Nucleosome-binding factor SPN, POB3 subunit [Trachipleistophora hominis]|uniref:FACT complex subunit POB3 n=1 Tax=Trachipleistophora hominis TaxID=72359 RepID=L7JYV8_TRAHO|nr:Nucleosome-binding factor SPN, POB3 subunit [Trachipleistophora hominis]
MKNFYDPSEMDDVISLDSLFLLSTNNGDENINLKLADKGIAMKNIENGAITTIKKDDIHRIELYRGTRLYNMRITTKTKIFNINNILEEKIEEIKKVCGHWYSINVYVKPLEIVDTTKGKVTFSEDYLEYRTDKLIFDVPLKDVVSVCSVKNEAVLGFDCDKEFDGVIEMRLSVPDENFVKNLRERSEIGQVKSIITFETLNNVSPRGKSDYIFSENYIRILGRTYEHKVLYSSIKKIIVLEQEKVVNIIINVDPSIKQGQTRYNFINLLFEKGIDEDFELELDSDLRSKYPSLEEKYNGELYETFIKIIELFTKQRVQVSECFKTRTNQIFLSCALRALEGFLFPISDAVIFLPKVIYMPHREIRLVEFYRVDVSVMTSKSFDMKIITYDSSYLFSSIDKDEFGALEKYFGDCNVEIRVEIVENEIPPEEEDDTTEIENEPSLEADESDV